MISVISSLRRESADRRDTGIKIGNLGWANASFGDLQFLFVECHSVESLKRGLVCLSWIDVLKECDTLNSLDKTQNE